MMKQTIAVAALATAMGFGASAWAQTSPAPSRPSSPPAAASTPSATTNFTDAPLRAYASPSADVGPLLQGGGAAGAEAGAQVRTSLERNNRDRETYDAIAARVRSDQTFAARVASLRATTTPGAAPQRESRISPGQAGATPG